MKNYKTLTLIQVKHIEQRRLTHALEREKQNRHIQARVNKVLRILGVIF